jgi:hypothetical protein
MLNKIYFTSYKTILISAVIIRLIAAIFSQGYGMHDDHFLIVEASASWVDGFDYNHWLPWSTGSRGVPEGHSFTYVGINYFIFSGLKGIGIEDPKLLMLFNRLLHAAFSLLIVHYGYKITEKLSSTKNAIIVGWILALLWVLPFLSVRNLVEVTCIPFMMWGIWLTLKSDNLTRYLYAGLLLGLAVSFRYQVAVFAAGMGLMYLFTKEFKGFLLYTLGGLITFSLTQGLVDYLIWGEPFAEFIGYATYNVNEGTEYIPNDNYGMYFLVLMGTFLFPLGLLIGFGFFRGFKKHIVLFVPVMIFIVFHSLYPSKQERFILPVMPIFLMVGVMGYDLLRSSEFWKKAWSFSYKAFWVLNIPLLLFASFTYSKKSRVESMYFFYGMDTHGVRILHEATGETGASLLPKFYTGNWTISGIARSDKSQHLRVYPTYEYDYILFCGEEDLQMRIAEYKTIFPKMELEKVCEPSLVDSILRWLNPRNRNEYIEIWKTNIVR